MNILLISREYPPETAYGGIATFVQLLARGLTGAGHDVAVISQTFGAEREERDMVDNRIRVLRVAVPSVGPVHTMTVSLHLFAQLFAKRVARAAAQLHAGFPFEVIETPDHLAEGLHCLEFAQARRIPVVTRLYTPWSLLARMGIQLPGADNPSDRAALGSMEEQLLRRSQALTAPSADLARRVQREYHLHGPIEMIPNPVDTERFRPPAARAATDAAPALLFVGRLEDRKGCRDLPALWARLQPRHPRLRLTILGPDTPNTGRPGTTMLQWLLAEFDRLGQGAAVVNRHGQPADPDHRPNAGTVVLTGRVELADLARVYRAHDILLAPSRYDNSPYTVVEALSSGMAVVAGDAGGCGEYLGAAAAPAVTPPGGYREAVAGRLVRPGDIAGLAAALEGVTPADSWLTDPANLRACQTAARRQAMQMCDPAQVAARTLALYAQARARIF